MVWFKVDDTLAFHPKAVAAGNAAMGLWARAGSWASQQLTDGYVPDDIAHSIGTRAEARKLVAVGFWIRKDDGYLFHQWNDDGRQPTRIKVETEREAARQRQARAREAASEKRAKQNGHA